VRSLRLSTGETLSAAHDARLINVLRAHGRKSVVFGCDDGSCGACRVLLDGALVRACHVPFSAVADGATLESYEDLGASPEARRVLSRFELERPTRCQLCIGALGVAAEYIERKGYTEELVDQTLQAASCKCTGRGSLRRALTREQ
jgi:aerobic-type carbon monoxide dehydrogenase small subunit (CoxS/CutS family)